MLQENRPKAVDIPTIDEQIQIDGQPAAWMSVAANRKGWAFVGQGRHGVVVQQVKYVDQLGCQLEVVRRGFH